ncbi:MAG: hypothetical protein ACTSP3_02035 [Candidatus Heimdallarchaeaceae archaeon]
MKYQIKRVEVEDNIAGLTQGLALQLPYGYDLLFGFTIQESGDETLRICKFKPNEDRIKAFSNIDFAKYDVKENVLIKLTDTLEHILSNYQDLSEVLNNEEKQLLDSSLKAGGLSSLLYSICYYKDRHFGFCFINDENNEPVLRFFRVDLTPSSIYPESFRKDYYAEHRYFGISLRDLCHREFLEALLEIFLEILERIQEGEPFFKEYPKYTDKTTLF